MTRPEVVEKWIEFTESFEGGVSSLYNDIRGLTTIAYGNLCNSPQEALRLAFVNPDGSPSTRDQIINGWVAVNSNRDADRLGWRYAAQLTNIRLPQAEMTRLALSKLDENDAILAKRFTFWNTMPSCAVMALHSLAWAAGPHFRYPKMIRALEVHDYYTAEKEVLLEVWTKDAAGKNIQNKGLIPRNSANVILMHNARLIEECPSLDRTIVEWKRLIA